MVPFVQVFFSLLTVIAMVDGLPNPKASSSTSPVIAPSNIVNAVCTSPSAHFNALELQIASLFCTGFLKVKPTTVTSEPTSYRAWKIETHKSRYCNSYCHCYDWYNCYRDHDLDRFYYPGSRCCNRYFISNTPSQHCI